MLSQRYYYQDAYMCQFHAAVIACEPHGNQWRVQLSNTAFYPTGGGQPNDTGTLNGAVVSDVYEENEIIWHICDQALEGDVQGIIDWPRRWDHMQQHAGQHLLSWAIAQQWNGVTIGLHCGAAVSTLDVIMPQGTDIASVSRESIEALELAVQQKASANHAILCRFPDADELAQLPLRKRPTVSEDIRIVSMGDFEYVACGGLHPSSTASALPVKIIDWRPNRGHLRVSFLCGERALADYQNRCTQTDQLEAILSVPLPQLADETARRLALLKEMEMALQTQKRMFALARMNELAQNAETVGHFALICATMEADMATLRDAANQLRAGLPSAVILLGAPGEDGCPIVLACADGLDVSAHTLLREILPKEGKGGGKADIAQGTVPTVFWETLSESLKTILSRYVTQP